MMEWSIEPLLGSWFVALLVALLLFASLSIAPSHPSLTPGRKRVLWCLRLIVIICFLIVTLRPGLVWRQEKSQPATIGVLIDSSASQQLPSGQVGKSRWQVEQEIWKQIEAVRGEEEEGLRIQPFFYSDRVEPIAAPVGTPLVFPERPQGTVTDLGQTLADLLSGRIDPPLTAAILVGDGTQTVIDSKLDPLQVARQMGQLDQPLLVVGVGPRGNAEDARDVAVEELPSELDAFAKNQVRLRGVARLRGLAGREVPLRVSLIDEKEQETTIQTSSLVAVDGDQIVPIDLPFVAPDPGQYRLVVTAETQAGEAVTTNNSATSFLTVRSGGIRVLYLEGQARNEQRFLRKSIQASPDIQLDFVLIPQSSKNRWPIDLSRSLEPGRYDAFVLGDLDSAAIGEKQLLAMRDRIASGAGLITLGGFHSFDGGGYGSSPLAEVLPVELRAGTRQAFDAQILPQLHWQEAIAVQPRGSHPITLLDTPENNLKVWKQLRPLEGANRWMKVKDTPGVQLLAVGAKEEPMLVVGQYQNGRVLAFAADSTWRWWMQGEEKRHKQFWRQSLLWVLGRDRIDPGLTITMDNRRLFRDQVGHITIRWDGGSQLGSPMPAVKVELVAPNRTTSELSITRRDEQTNIGQWTAKGDPGLYRIRASTTVDGKPITAELPFMVLDNSLEMSSPIPDWQLLSQLADLTGPAGGKMINPEEIKTAIDALRERWKNSKTEIEMHRKLGDRALDNWVLLLIFAILLGGEWWLRKRWQLV